MRMGNLIGRAYVALSLVRDRDGFGLRRQGTRTVYGGSGTRVRDRCPVNWPCVPCVHFLPLVLIESSILYLSRSSYTSSRIFSKIIRERRKNKWTVTKLKRIDGKATQLREFGEFVAKNRWEGRTGGCPRQRRPKQCGSFPVYQLFFEGMSRGRGGAEWCTHDI